MTADITLLCVYHNRASAVDASLQSLAAQDHPSWRAIVVDDGSTDDTLARLRAFQSDRIEIRSQRNQGFTPTIARLAAEVDGAFIAIHGAGDESLPHRLSAQSAMMRAHPELVAVGCAIENVDVVSGRRWEVRPRQRILKGPIRQGFGISHGEVMFRKDAYMRAGGYRALFRYGQATDLFRRLSRLGDFGYVDDVLYRRFLMEDGVNADLRKVAERDLYNALSAVAHEQELEGSADDGHPATLRDIIDRHGALAPYMLPPQRDIAIGLARAAIKYSTAGDRDQARILARRSLRETLTLQGLICRVAIAAGVGPLKPVMQQLVMRGSKGTDEHALSRLDRARQPGAEPR